MKQEKYEKRFGTGILPIYVSFYIRVPECFKKQRRFAKDHAGICFVSKYKTRIFLNAPEIVLGHTTFSRFLKELNEVVVHEHLHAGGVYTERAAHYLTRFFTKG